MSAPTSSCSSYAPRWLSYHRCHPYWPNPPAWSASRKCSLPCHFPSDCVSDCADTWCSHWCAAVLSIEANWKSHCRGSGFGGRLSHLLHCLGSCRWGKCFWVRGRSRVRQSCSLQEVWSSIVWTGFHTGCWSGRWRPVLWFLLIHTHSFLKFDQNI